MEETTEYVHVDTIHHPNKLHVENSKYDQDKKRMDNMVNDQLNQHGTMSSREQSRWTENWPYECFNFKIPKYKFMQNVTGE